MIDCRSQGDRCLDLAVDVIQRTDVTPKVASERIERLVGDSAGMLMAGLCAEYDHLEAAEDAATQIQCGRHTAPGNQLLAAGSGR